MKAEIPTIIKGQVRSVVRAPALFRHSSFELRHLERLHIFIDKTR